MSAAHDAALYDAGEYLIAGLDNQAEWWEHLGDAHRDYAALARAAKSLEVALEAANQALREALDCKGPYNGTVSEFGGYPAICEKCVERVRQALGAAGDPE